MNLCQHFVTKVLSVPHLAWEYYHVKVEYNSYGYIGTTSIMFKNYDEACKVDIGYEFEA